MPPDNLTTCDVTGWAIPAFRDARYMALARTLAQPAQPDAPLSEADMLARLSAIEARFGHGAMASMCILTRNSDKRRVGVTVLDAQYFIIAQATGVTFAAALDAMDALEREAAALRGGVA